MIPDVWSGLDGPALSYQIQWPWLYKRCLCRQDFMIFSNSLSGDRGMQTFELAFSLRLGSWKCDFYLNKSSQCLPLLQSPSFGCPWIHDNRISRLTVRWPRQACFSEKIYRPLPCSAILSYSVSHFPSPFAAAQDSHSFQTLVSMACRVMKAFVLLSILSATNAYWLMGIGVYIQNICQAYFLLTCM